MSRCVRWRIPASVLASLLLLVSARAQDRPPHPDPTFADVKYGPHERNVLDFWRAPGEGPRPLIVHIHGGGFVGGDKRQFSPILLREARESEISCRHPYRFVGSGHHLTGEPAHCAAPYNSPLRAQEWNIDPSALPPSRSAGRNLPLIGFTTTWPTQNSDPVIRQSPASRPRLPRADNYPHHQELIGGRAGAPVSLKSWNHHGRAGSQSDPSFEAL